jgi:hypothetical protein
VAEAAQARRKAYGAPKRHVPALVFVHVVGAFYRHRGPMISTTSVLQALTFHDSG